MNKIHSKANLLNWPQEDDDEDEGANEEDNR
jgi:hypothetical protein